MLTITVFQTIKNCLVLLTLIGKVVSTSTSYNHITCDFETYESGCEDKLGSYCETETQKCVCKPDYPIPLLGYCLSRRSLGESCYTSAQCNQTGNSSCFIFGKDYDTERMSGGHNVGRQIRKWPKGVCKCNLGYQYDNQTKACVKKVIGSWCTDDWDCIKEIFNSQCTKPQHVCECIWNFFFDTKTNACVQSLVGEKCSLNADCASQNLICSQPSGKCMCPDGYRQNTSGTPVCIQMEGSLCEEGYEWVQLWNRCFPIKSSNQQIQRTKLEEEPVIKKDETFNALKLLFIVPAALILFMVGRYAYLKRREEMSEEDTDFERNIIRDEKQIKAKLPLTNGTKPEQQQQKQEQQQQQSGSKEEEPMEAPGSNLGNGESMDEKNEDETKKCRQNGKRLSTEPVENSLGSNEVNKESGDEQSKKTDEKME